MNGRLIILAGGISSRMKSSQTTNSVISQKLIQEAESKSKSMLSVGNKDRPFLDYLLYNANQSDYREVVIVIGQNDFSIKDYYSKEENKKLFQQLEITYAVQPIPDGRAKPLGTADALLVGMKSKPDWNGKSFTVCNSDNLYSQKVLWLMKDSPFLNALIDYDRDGLGCEKERIERFAVTKKNEEGFLLDIIEKPTAKQIELVKGKDGFVGVSMNIFRFSYEMILPFLEIVPLHPVRNEKEIPTAIMMMLEKFPESVFAYQISEEVPDLTNKDDIIKVKIYLEKHFNNIL